MRNFDQLWRELENEAQTGSEKGTLKRRVSSQSAKCPFFLGIRLPGFKRAFIIQVPKDISPLPEALPSSKGFDFDVLIAGDEDNSNHVSIILSSARTEYHDVFGAIAKDLFSTLQSLKSPLDIVAGFLNRVRLWQIFFEKQGGEGLSPEAQKGLFGEIYFLKEYVLPINTGEDTLRRWTASDNRQHDFQFGLMSVEVKTSSAKQHQTLRIASEQQLDETLVDELLLFHLSVSLVENTPLTLPSLIDEVRQLLADNPGAGELFNNMLLTRGYSDTHRGLYERTGYAIRRSGFYQVRGQFPRIIEADLRRGVGDVGYSISLDACSDYVVEKQRIIQKLREVLR